METFHRRFSFHGNSEIAPFITHGLSSMWYMWDYLSSLVFIYLFVGLLKPKKIEFLANSNGNVIR